MIRETHVRGRARVGLIVLGAVFLAGAGVALYVHTRPVAFAGPARHVIIISLDTTRADHFGCYGNREVRTPNIDALAAESILLSDCMTVVPTTLSSHVSLFTGKYPHHHGVPRNGHVVHGDNVMLAEVLAGAGFRGLGFLGSFALERRFGVDQGFAYWEDGTDDASQWELRVGVDLAQGVDQDQRRAEAVTDSVIRYLDRHGVPQNMLLFVHYFDPHEAYDAPAPFDAAYRHPQDPGGPIYYPFVRVRLADAPEGPHPAAEILKQRYKGEISYMDHHVGRLIDDLRRRGVLDESILIVVSDHGENLDEHFQFMDHGFCVFQTTMRLVCLVRLPGGAHGGTRIDEPLMNIDLLPSVLSYLGLPMPPGVDGRAIDLANARVPFSGRACFGEATKPSESETDPRWVNINKARCVRVGRYKYMQVPWLTAESRIPLPREALFDLSVDPQERVNLLASPTEEQAALAAELRGLLEAWSASGRPLPSEYDASQQEDTRRRLAALSYVEYAGTTMTFEEAARRASREMLERLRSLGYERAMLPVATAPAGGAAP